MKRTNNIIPMRGGGEQDALTSWRHVMVYLTKAGRCKKLKKQYNKRVRKFLKEEDCGEVR